MRITVPTTAVKKSIARARSVGTPSEKNDLARLDRLSMRVIRKGSAHYLQVGGIGAISYVTNVPGVPDTPFEVGEFVYVKNELSPLLTKLGTKAKSLTFVFDEALEILDGKSNEVLLRVALIDARTFEPSLNGDGDIWIPVNVTERAPLWCSLPNGHGLQWAFKHIPALTGAGKTIQHSAEVVRLVIVDTPDSLHETIDFASGLLFMAFGTDSRIMASSFTPVVRRGVEASRPIREGALGYAEQDVDESPLVAELNVSRAVAGDVAALISPDEPVRLRVEFLHRGSGEGVLTPCTCILTNGLSLIRFPVDMSGLYTGSLGILSVFEALLTKPVGGMHVSVPSDVVKRVAGAAAVRGSGAEGLLVVLSAEGLTVSNDPNNPNGGTSVHVPSTTWWGQPSSQYVDGKALASALGAMGSFMSLSTNATHLIIECANYRIVLPTLK